MRLKGISQKGLQRIAQSLSDPWQNMESDIQDALYHVENSLMLDFGTLDIDMFNVSKDPSYDYSILVEGQGWSEWDRGELMAWGQFNPNMADELDGYREMAPTWPEEGFPAIIVVDGIPSEIFDNLDGDNKEYASGYLDIADGRGRSSVAYGMGLETLPAVILTPRNPL